MSTQDVNKQFAAAQGSPAAVVVWRVFEYIEYEPPKQEQVSSYVLATSALEACEIVGTDERREIVAVEKVCDISSLPDDRYGITLMARRRDGRAVVPENHPTTRQAMSSAWNQRRLRLLFWLVLTPLAVAACTWGAWVMFFAMP